jgi:hypothetical protein
MGQRSYSSRFRCGHAGCTEFVLFSDDRRADQAKTQQRHGNGQWKCVRHSRPSEVVALDRPQLVRDLEVVEVEHGKYWKWPVGTLGSGFVSGPGFQAHASDFPPGTVLRITAELVSTPTQKDTKDG